jgi:hypothetical protein
MCYIPSWEAYTRSAGQGFSAVFTTATYWSLSWDRWIQSTYSGTSTKFTLILLSHLSLGFPSCLFDSDFLIKIFCALLTVTMYVTWLTYHILLDFIMMIVFGEEYNLLNYSLCNFLHLPVTFPLFCRSNLLCALLWNVPNLCSFLRVEELSFSLI